MNETALDRTIIALDNMSKSSIFEFLKTIEGRIPTVKIGMETFYRYGRNLVEEISDQFQLKIFLDLKLHDIPNTVFKSINALEGLPIKFLTLHLTGGAKMVEDAILSARESLPKTSLLGVSYLTSLGSNDFEKIFSYQNNEEVNKALERLFHMALSTGLHGVVLSGNDLAQLNALSKNFSRPKILSVCPGIRFQDEIDSQNIQDQNRVCSPRKAIDDGADFLVIGRSLTQTDKLEVRIQELENIKILPKMAVKPPTLDMGI